MSGFTPEQKAAVMLRDGGQCAMHAAVAACTFRADTVNHRQNRSTGGRDRLANAVAICHTCNGLIESDAAAADAARRRGVKLRPHQDPELVPLWSPFFRQFVLVTDDALTLTGDTEHDTRGGVYSDRVGR